MENFAEKNRNAMKNLENSLNMGFLNAFDVLNMVNDIYSQVGIDVYMTLSKESQDKLFDVVCEVLNRNMFCDITTPTDNSKTED